jgi:copper resistance protein D
MIPPPLLNAFILSVHLLAAVFFVGGSFFMWLVVVPASRLFVRDESQRTRLVGEIAKRFGRLTTPVLVVLVLTGIYNASWYLPSVGSLLTTVTGQILLVKMVSVAALLLLIYVHNVYFGRRIVLLAREGKLGELKAIRKRSRIVSAVNLALMVVILFLAVLLQMPS